MARIKTVDVPWSKLKENLAKILVENNYLNSQEVVDHQIILSLKYDKKTPAVTEIKRISRQSLRVYVSKDKLPRVLGGMGIAVISTPKGLMTNKEAYKQNLGGEIICEIF